MSEKIYTVEAQKKIVAKIEKYIKETDIPIVAEFAYLNEKRRQTLYDHPLLSDAIKKLIEKKEFALERQGLENKVNTGMAIFSLKQLGWTDKQEVANTIEFNGKEFADALERADTSPTTIIQR